MSTTEQKIEEILKVHFCDAPDIEVYENQLRVQSERLAEENGIKRLSEYYKALGDEKRLLIVRLLGFREMCVCELTGALGISQPNLSHHIKKLEQAGVVKSERRGKWVYYNLVDVDVLSRLFI
ncbi:MAG: metalloregulator ArsR/SmtB family transcription factor [Candidatus Bathyarchaeota archaeon]|nr:metalloregulator ArsR/SmtB family transcription factor [Candidatus Bathyarchaeota archaeon]